MISVEGEERVNEPLEKVTSEGSLSDGSAGEVEALREPIFHHKEIDSVPSVEGTIRAKEECPYVYRAPNLPIRIIILLVVSTMAQSFSSSIISIFMNTDLHLSASDQLKYYMYLGFTSWPEPAIGFIADAFVVFGERRRPLFLIGCVVNIVIYLVYCFKPSATSNVSVFFGVSMIAQIFLMTIYISLNGLLVDVGRKDAETHEESTARIGSIMSKAMIWRSFGTLVSAILQTYILVYINVRTTLGITAVFFFLLIPLVLLTPRRYFLKKKNVPNIFMRFIEATKQIKETFNFRDYRSDGFCFLLVLIFVFLYTMMPDSGNIYYTYLYSYGYEAWFYSLISCVGDAGSICGAYLFSFWMDRKAKKEAAGGHRASMFFIFFLGSVAWALGYVTNIMLTTGFIEYTLHIRPDIFIPIDYFFTSLFVRFAFMPTVAVAAEHAPKSFEATVFEVFSVASLGGGTVSNIITLAIVDSMHIGFGNYGKLWIVVLISICCKLSMIPLAWLLPDRRVESDQMSLDDGSDLRGDVGFRDACKEVLEDGRSLAELSNSKSASYDHENTN